MAAPPEARGLEVRLLRRLPAQRARLRGRAARARRRGRHRLLPRGVERDRSPGPYDLSLVEGSITTPEDAERIQRVRRQSRRWSRSAPAPPPAGSRRCATSPTSRSSSPPSTPRPSTSRRSRPRRRSPTHVHVDFELHGCPIDKRQLLEVHQRLPQRAPARDRRRTASASSASARGNVCVMVAHGTPCLGPVTHAGCGALCPSYDRGCYGCFGPMETPRPEALSPLARRASAMRGGRPRARVPDVQRRRRAVPRGERSA